MIGSCQPDGTISGSFGQILKKGGLEIKVLVRSGETDQTKKDMIGDKVIGYGWNSQ